MGNSCQNIEPHGHRTMFTILYIMSSLSPMTTEQMTGVVNGVAGPSKLERGSSSSDQEESLCQEDIQKLLGLQQSKVSLDKVSFISSKDVADLFFNGIFQISPPP